MLNKDKGICIRTVDYSETSQILTFFTEQNGKISAIAKGAKRPKSSFGGAFEILTTGKMVFNLRPSDKLATLTEFEQDFFPVEIRKNLLALNSGLFAAELLNSFTIEHDPHPGLFNETVSFLTDIQAADDREVLVLLILFQLALFDQTGSGLTLNCCTNCKLPYSRKWQQGFFSSIAGGLVCADCEQSFPDKIPMDKTALDCLDDMKKMTSAEKTVLSRIEKILISHITETLSKPPRMANMILSLMK